MMIKEAKKNIFVHIAPVFVMIICFNSIGLTDADLLLEGDVTIASILDIQDVTDGNCGDINVPSVMVMEAIRWYLEKVNNDETLPFKLGLSYYKTCGNTGLAGQHAVDILSKYRMARVTNSSEDFIVGVLGPSYSSEAQIVSSILGSQLPSERLIQMGYSSTSTVLNDRIRYPNYYRVISEDGIQITTMVHLMKSLEWNRIAVVYENDTYGRIGAESLDLEAAENSICISQSYPITLDSSRNVHLSQLNDIIEKIAVLSPSVQGVVYIGGKVVANKIFQIINNLQSSEVPIFIVSEATQLQLDVFKSAGSGILSDAKGTLVVSAPYSEEKDFKSYWNSLFTNIEKLRNASGVNPYLFDVFEAYSGCDIRKGSCLPLTDADVNAKASPQSVYVNYGVLATHTLVEVLKKVSARICNGECSSVQEFKDNFNPGQVIFEMDNLTVSYNGISLAFTKDSPNGKVGPKQNIYEVYNYREGEESNAFELVNVGYMTNDEFVLNKDDIRDYASDGSERKYPNVRKGQCPIKQVCDECIRSDLAEVDFHIPGDFYIVGIVSINNRAIPGPQGCGSVRTRHGYQMFLTLQFVLEEFKIRSWYDQYVKNFAGHSIGVIVINSCNNDLEVVRKILTLHSKGLKLPNGDTLDIKNRILGYVGGQSTDVSAPAAEQLTKLKFVQVSYSSTNPILSNKDLYPYFLRIITPDNVQAKAMIDIVKELNGKYIQIVYSEGAYGEGGYEAVVEAAAAAYICIAQSILVKEKDRYYEYFETLRKKPHAKLVIVFLRSHVVGPFMRDMDEGEMKRGDFQFIGSEAWGKNSEILDYKKNKGSITVAVEMDKNTYLEEFLKHQIPTFNMTNPWLEEYIQNRQKCHFDWSFNKKYEAKCTEENLPISDVDFESDPWCIFVFNTMISFLKGAANFYDKKCGKSSSKTLCEDFVNHPEDFVEVMKKVRMNIYGSGDILIYDEKGDGLMGYKVYNIKDTADKQSMQYTQVGSFSLNGGLIFEKGNVGYPTDATIVSSCPNEQACKSCQPVPEPVEVIPEEPDSTPIILGIIIAVCGVIIIVLIVVIILKFRKNKQPRDSTYLTPHGLNSTYLTPNGLTASMGSDWMYEGERQVGEGAHQSDGSEIIPEEKF